ncbi:MAG: MFS transporter [Kiritimatiellales bacterium]
MKKKHGSAESKDRASVGSKAAFSGGAFSDSIMQGALPSLANPVFNMLLHVNPALISTALAIARLWDAITDPLMGSISDNTRTRWGRRRPYIALGGILSGICFSVFWFFFHGMSPLAGFFYFLIGSIIFYTCYTIFSVPYTAMGFEMSSDYHERTRIQALRVFFGSLGGILVGWIFRIAQCNIFKDTVEGLRYTGCVVGVIILVLALLPALFVREKSVKRIQVKNKIPLGRSIRESFRNSAFRTLLAALIMTVLGAVLVGSLGFYINVYYVHAGDLKSASTMQGFSSMVFQFSNLASIPILTAVSSRIGKRKTLMGCLVIGIIGALSKWVCYTPDIPWLVIIPSILLAPCYSAAWTLTASMVADVCDEDDLKTGERREGMFGAIYWWVFKVGVTVSLCASGFILTLSGFDVLRGGAQSATTFMVWRLLFSLFPFLVFSVAFFLIARFPLTEERVHEIRKILEGRNRSHEGASGEMEEALS